MRFRYPINFVTPDHLVWPELRAWDGSPLDEGILSKRSGGIMNNWVLRTYYELRLAGCDVALTPRPRPDAINVVSILDFGRRDRRIGCFTVFPQADAHDTRLADFRIFQNGLRDGEDNTASVWHWPQPGIIPRDPARGARLETLVYKGRLVNLSEEFKSDAFRQALSGEGVTFDIDAFDGLHADHSWNDYRTADAVLAVRNMTFYDARKKPASKLVNAWFAEVPALLGPEPAFRELRESAHDYIEIHTPRDVIAALRGLRAEPDRYRAMVETGRRRRSAFTTEALTQRWIDILSGPVTDAYGAWRRTPVLRRYVRGAAGILKENAAREANRVGFTTGPRILDAARQAQEALS